jgi:hypothetical protein
MSDGRRKKKPPCGEARGRGIIAGMEEELKNPGKELSFEYSDSRFKFLSRYYLYYVISSYIRLNLLNNAIIPKIISTNAENINTQTQKGNSTSPGKRVDANRLRK